MIMYSKADVKNILEEFLAQYFQFSYVVLDERLEEIFNEACADRGVEVENFEEQ